MARHSCQPDDPARMSCASYQIFRRPQYRDDLDAIEAWVARDNPLAAADLWLLIDDQVSRLADPLFQYMLLYMLMRSVSGAPAMAQANRLVCVMAKAV